MIFTTLYYCIKSWGKLSENQEKAILKAMNPVISNHVGDVGQKKEFKLTLEKVFSFEGQWGTSYIYSFLDESGNVVVYKGSKGFEVVDPTSIERLGYETNKYAAKGDKVSVIAKVKAHTDYKGTKQTIIERPKVKDIVKK